VSLTAQRGSTLSYILAAIFLAASMLFVYRSFYKMRIEIAEEAARARAAA
jgi:hypothetical protein